MFARQFYAMTDCPMPINVHLTCERKQVFVDDLGCLAVPLVLLGLLDVLVHLSLRLEPISTALIRAGEWSLFSLRGLMQVFIKCR